MKQALRGVAGTALLVVSSFVAGPVAPAAAATSCLTVPATTPGFTVGIGGTPQRIPSFSGISVCASTPDGSPVAPAVSNAVGGACVASCTTVSLQVSPLDLGPLSVTYVQDGVTNRHAVDPAAVGTSQGICLVSVGTPQAPVPSCTLSLGSDQNLPGAVADLIAQTTTLANQKVAEANALAAGAVTQATALANQKVADANALAASLRRTVEETAAQLVATGCNTVPDGPNGEDACTNPVGWTSATALRKWAEAQETLFGLVASTCNSVPDGPNGQDACTNPVGWTSATAFGLVASTCNSVPDGPYGEDACTNPYAWASAVAAQKWAEIDEEIRRRFQPVCDRVPNAGDGSEFCGGADAWAQWFIDRLTNPPAVSALIDEIECTIDPDSCWW